jgi:hypothetical protein
MNRFDSKEDIEDLSASYLALFLSLLLALIAVSEKSFWIDEAQTAIFAMSDTFSELQQVLETDKGSTVQMPLYIVSLWAWEKLFGYSEFSLRAFNLPFLVIALLVAAKYIELPCRDRLFFLLFAFSSPFLWAYLDEVRPYILQFLGSLLVIASLWNAATPFGAQSATRLPLQDLLLFSVGAIILCGSSLIGVIYAFFFGLSFLVAWLRRELISAIFKRSDFWIVAGFSTLFLLSLGAYYLWTLQMGAKASSVGKTNLLSIGFAIYEFLGFSGLGPGRAELRENPLGAMKAYFPSLAAFAATCAAFFLVGLRNLLKKKQNSCNCGLYCTFPVILLTATVIVSAASVIALGMLGQFRIVGRHFMPLFPFFLLSLSVIAAALWESKKMWQRGVIALLLIASLASSLSLRFTSTHAKDDYRSAAAEACAVLDQGGVVWWAADAAGAKYYGLPPMLRGVPAAWPANDAARIVIVSNLPALELEKMPPPSLIILSKTDIYDNTGSITRYIEKNGFTLERNAFPAFSLARKSASAP